MPIGPLSGVRVIDLSGLGPGPFATLMLADFGATVLCVRRPDPMPFDPAGGVARGKAAIGIDLRDPRGQQVARRLAAEADVLVEGFRPGVMERLGLGPDTLLELNPRLVYGRLTGWGQSGPYARRAGHDINYLAISGALGVTGQERPTAPPGLLGDLANGSYLLIVGILMALLERERTGRGQVVDGAIVDGAAYMLSPMFGELALGQWDGDLRHNMIAGAAPFYGVYQCADARWFSVGAIEPKFYAAFLEVLGLKDVDPSPAAQMEAGGWPALRMRVAAVFVTRPQAEWTELFAEAEACGAPVLDVGELATDPHLAERQAVVDRDGRLSAAPAPRLSGHPELAAVRSEPEHRAAEDILAEAGLGEGEIRSLLSDRVIWSA